MFEIFDLLIAGKKLTKAEKQQNNLSAKNLYKTAENLNMSLLTGMKTKQLEERACSAVMVLMDIVLLDSYDKAALS